MTEALHIYLEDDPDAPGVKTSRLEVEGDDWTFLSILDALSHEAEVVRSRMVETGIRQVAGVRGVGISADDIAEALEREDETNSG